MSPLPDALAPARGARGCASDDRQGLAARVSRGWELLADYAESCDLEAPARPRGRTGVDVLAPVGRWSDSRSLGDVVGDARAGRVERIDQDAYERRLRASHAQAAPAAVVGALRAARTEIAAWFGSSEDELVGLTLTASPLGALPVRTFLHAAVYQLAVVALDLEPCSPDPVPAELLTLGLVALVDSSGCLAARRGLHASLVADTRDASGTGGVWGFGSADGAWRVAELAEPLGPTVTASPRVVLDITAGRTTNVPGLIASGALRLHDIPGLLHVAPLVDEVPGIPGASALRAATTSLSAASTVLGLLRRPFGAGRA